jgi:hypothetical protein
MMRDIEGFRGLAVEIAKVYDFRVGIFGLTEPIRTMEEVGYECGRYLEAVRGGMGNEK